MSDDEKHVGEMEVPVTQDVEVSEEKEAQEEVASDESGEEIQVEPISIADLEERSKVDISAVIEKLEEPRKPDVKNFLKRDYITHIKRLCPGRFSERILARMRKDDLRRTLADCWERGVEDCASVHSFDEDEKVERVERTDADVLCKTMYSVVLLGANAVEMMSKKFSCYLGNYCLHGYARTLDEERNRTALLQILRELEVQHSELIKSYCTLESRMTMIFLLSAVQSITHMDQIKDVN